MKKETALAKQMILDASRSYCFKNVDDGVSFGILFEYKNGSCEYNTEWYPEILTTVNMLLNNMQQI